jgi:hypothetical protein
MPLLLAATLASTAARAACPAAPAQVEAQLDAAQVAFSAMAGPAFQAATAEVVAGLECLSAPLASSLAARVHRVVGLREFVARRESAALQSFAAARAIDPSYEFPTTLVPADHPVRKLFAEALAVPSAATPLPAPGNGHLEIDGTTATARADARALVAEWIDASGAVASSGYRWPGDAMIPYPIQEAPVEAAPIAAPREAISRKKGPNTPLTVGAVATLVAAGAVQGLAIVSNANFENPATPRDQLPALQTQTNASQVSAIGLGVVGLGLGVGAVVAGNW